MAIKTKYTFPNASGANGQSTTVFANHGIELNNQDDLDVYVYLSTTGRVLQYRQSTGSTTDSNHPQVNDTTGLYFPSVSTGVTLYNYTLSTDFNTITFNSAIPTGGIVSVERRTRDSSSNYTNFTSGGSIRSTELNSAFDESNFTAQEARNKAFDLENKLLYSNYTPYKDDTIDLGSITYQWKDLWIDGTAYLDAVDIDAGSIDGTTIGGSTPAAGTFTTLTTSSTATVNGNIVVTGTISDSGGNLELADDVNISGHLRLPDDKKLYLGNGDDASIDWDTDGWTDRLEIRSAGNTYYYVGSGDSHAFFVDSALPLGVDGTKLDVRVDVKPYPSNAIDLGKSDGQWKDLYVDGTGYIDTVSADNLTVSGTTTLAAGSINTSEIADDAVTTAKLASNSVVSASIVDGTIVAGDLADNAVTTAKIADDAVTGSKIAHNTITVTNMAANSVDSTQYVDGSIDPAHLASNAVTTVKIANDAVTRDKIATSAIGTNEIDSGSITSALLATDSVTTTHIVDAELTTLAGMQSGTASKLADSTALTADIADLNQIDGLTKQTTISDSDASFPTSGAVVDYVASQLDPVGGLEVIATDAAFPNTQPASGVVVSIADAGGLVVNGSGVSTTGRTVGGSTVTINNINSQFNSTTIDNGVAMMVSSTGSGQVYNYHKATLREQDILSISSDIQSFGNRYRVGSSNPTSDNDAGDLFFNTATDKLLVRNAANNSWDEAQSVGNFYISTLSPAFNNVLTEFTITNAPSYASQILLIINGVLQKPNAGTSAPADGFALDGSTIKLGGAPATGSTYSAVVIGSTVNIGTPSDNTVSAAVLQSGSVTTAKIAADAVDGTKIADDAVGAEHIEVLDSHLQLADSCNIKIGTGDDLQLYHNGSHSYIEDSGTGNLYIRSSNTRMQSSAGEDQIILVEDGSVELYYNGVKKFQTESYGNQAFGEFFIGDGDGTDASNHIRIGNGGDLKIHHDGTRNIIDAATSKNIDFYYGGAQQFWFGNAEFKGIDNKKIILGTGDDLQIYHDGSNSIINDAGTGSLRIAHDGNNHWEFGDAAFKGNDGRVIILGDSSDLRIYHSTVNRFDSYGKNNEFINKDTDGSVAEYMVKMVPNGATELYYDGSKKLETLTSGVLVSDWLLELKAGSGSWAYLRLTGDNGANNNDLFQFGAYGGVSVWQNKGSGSWETNIECNADGNVELYYDNSLKADTYSEGFRVYGDLIPNNDDARNLGKSGYRWDEVWSANGSIQTSDRNEKNTITESDLGLGFINKLKPISYKWNKDKDTIHYGLIAQDLEEVLNTIGKPISDFGGLKKPENAPMGLNYSQLISPLIKAIQELSTKVETLETKVAALEAK